MFRPHWSHRTPPVPVGAGQSTGRTPKRPSGARQSMAREHPPSTQTQHQHRLRVVCGRSHRVARSQNRRAASSRPTAPVAAGRMPCDQRKSWSPSTHRSPIDYRRFARGACVLPEESTIGSRSRPSLARNRIHRESGVRRWSFRRYRGAYRPRNPCLRAEGLLRRSWQRRLTYRRWTQRPGTA
jgi:hypothetical protein